MEHIISADLVDKDNAARKANLERDYASLGERLDRRGIAIDAIRDKVEKFAVAIPSWASAPAARALPAFPVPASHATSSTRSRIAPSSSN